MPPRYCFAPSLPPSDQCPRYAVVVCGDIAGPLLYTSGTIRDRSNLPAGVGYRVPGGAVRQFLRLAWCCFLSVQESGWDVGDCAVHRLVMHVQPALSVWLV